MPGPPVTHIQGSLRKAAGSPCNMIQQTRRVPIGRHTPGRFFYEVIVSFLEE